MANGATRAEAALDLPGDNLVPDANEVFDRATTLPAPAEDIWPWIAQLGKGRGGWYFPRWAERLILPRRRGRRDIDPSLTQLRVGDDHADWGPGDPVFRVAVVAPPHVLVYHSLRDRTARHSWPADDSAERPEVLPLSWALVLRDAGGQSTRLQIRLRMRVRSKPLAAVGGAFDWATVELLFAGLRERLAA